jgi:starch-binding outer membrane protein, SusD/RagB family
MKHIKYIFSYITGSFLALALTGCTDKYLDKEYDTTLSEETVFASTTLTKEYLANLYTFLPDGLGPFSDLQYLNASRDCMTDNATAYWSLIYYNKIRADAYTSSSHPLAESFWTSYFTGIRRCNIFLKNISSSVISDEVVSGSDDSQLYTRYKAEAKFLRALFHFELVAYFGDAPILEDVIYSVDNSDMLNVTRTDAAEVLEWVAAQCDSVKDILPFRYSSEGNWGRINGAAAYALKSRALLYRASTLHNTESNSDWWQEAADAAKEFIDTNEAYSNPYSIYTYTGTLSSTSLPSSIVNADQGTLNYMYCFITKPYNNNEVIFARSLWTTYVIDFSFLPFGSFSGAYGRTNPTQNLVDAYETKNGEFIEEDDTYDDQDPYTNRDPRLEATIFHHGSVWGRPDYGEEATVDVHYNSSTDEGVDYMGSSGGTYTGYYVKKWVNPDLIFNTSYLSAPSHSWIIYRYAEILLNYAEALNEALSSPSTDVYSAVNKVRTRANMPDLPAGLTKTEMRERIRNERRVEFAFEDHRYFDVRRWKLYYDQTTDPIVTATYRNHIYNLYSANVKISGTKTKYTYSVNSNVSPVSYTTPKNDYWPIPYSETISVPTLGQNDGW